MTSQQSKNVVAAAFEGWARGDGDFFSILADDVVWTITGSSPVAGIYTSRQAFLEGAIEPISARLSQPIRPTVERIITEGDTVVVLWDGHAVAKDGQPYDNRYCWVMRIEDGKVKEAIAFFDSTMLTELWQRVGSYEPDVAAISRSLLMPLPSWLPSDGEDAWQSARGRIAGRWRLRYRLVRAAWTSLVSLSTP